VNNFPRGLRLRPNAGAKFGKRHFGDRLYDSDGVSNLQEYLNGTDPNKVMFSTVFSSDHVSASMVSGTITVWRGVPSQMAILVNTTNFTSASWIPFTSAFTALLPQADGPYQVWVGLRGLSQSSLQTWDGTTIVRDTTAPPLFFTNPVSGVTSRPMIQLQGFSPEPLSRLSCAVSNTAGVFTNLQGFVTRQFYDTNRNQFTTNYFQCYDIDITNGANTVSVYAADLAGNTTVTNLVFTLVTDTIAPVMSQVWPQNGMMLCGTNFTVDGWLDDPTALVAASIVDTNGNTNAVGAVVERDGRFWIEDLPLCEGTNLLSITAVDAWNNMAVTNITVVKSDFGLTVTPIDPEQLYKTAVIVQGTVADHYGTVWVNGVQAVNTAGSWEADKVPFNSGGTATFRVAAYAAGHDLQSGAANLLTTNVTKRSRLYVDQDFTADVNLRHWYNDQNDGFSEQDIYGGHFWADNEPGNGWWSGYETNHISGVSPDSTGQCECTVVWPASNWPDLAWGQYTRAQNGGSFSPSFTDGSPPTLINAHYNLYRNWTSALNGFQVGQAWYTNYQHANRAISGQTTWQLFTGGKAVAHKQNLFTLSGLATELIYGNITDDLISSVGVAYTNITIGGLGQLGADANLYVLLPDNITTDVTPRTSRKIYTFNLGSQKSTLNINAKGVTLNPDQVVTNARFCVGQQITFKPVWDLAPSSVIFETNKWHFDGNFVNESFKRWPSGSTDWTNNPNLLTNETTDAWWTSGQSGFPGELYHAHLTQGLTFANGQTALMSVQGLFNMHRPQYKNVSTNNFGNVGVQIVHSSEGSATLTTSPEADIIGLIKSQFSGDAAVTQLVNGYATNLTLRGDTLGAYWLDNQQFSLSNHFPVIANDFTGNTFRFADEPTSTCSGNGTIMHYNFNTYLRFKPDGDGSIYITLGVIMWHDYAQTTLTFNPSTGNMDYTPFSPRPRGPAIPGEAQWDSGLLGSEAFPCWTNIYSNLGQ